MEKSSTFLQITPFLDVPSLESALVFFCEILGFEVRLRVGDYAYVHRETAGVRLIEKQHARRGNGRFAYYIDVSDLDVLYAELKPKLDTLPAGHVAGPIDQDYGQRELIVEAPDGDLVVFGQFIGERTRKSRPLDLVKRDLRGSRFTNVALANTRFTNVDLSDARFENVRLSHTAFANVALTASAFKGTDFSAVDISNSRLAGMRIEGILVTDLIESYRKTRAG